MLRRLRPLLAPALEEESRWLPRIRRVSTLARPSFVSPTTMAIAESFSSSLTVSADPRNFITRIRPLMLFSTVASSGNTISRTISTSMLLFNARCWLADESDKEGWDMEWEEEECVDPRVFDLFFPIDSLFVCLDYGFSDVVFGRME